MKKFLVAGVAFIAFAILLPVVANAQSCRWRNSRAYVERDYGYNPVYYYDNGYRNGYHLAKLKRFLKERDRFRNAYYRRYYAPRNVIYVSYRPRPVRWYY